MNTTTLTVQTNPLWSIVGTIMMVLGILSIFGGVSFLCCTPRGV